MELSKRQREIIDISIKIIAKEGLERLTIKNISSALNITDAAIYRHFNSKNEILAGILDEFQIRTEELFNEADINNTSPIEKIYRILSARIEEFTNNPAYVIILFSEKIFQNNPELDSKVFAVLKMNIEHIRGYIIEGQNSDTIRKDIRSEELFTLIMGTFRFTVLRWKLSGYQNNLREMFENNWNMIITLLNK